MNNINNKILIKQQNNFDEFRELFLLYLKNINILSKEERECYVKYFTYVTNLPFSINVDKDTGEKK